MTAIVTGLPYLRCCDLISEPRTITIPKEIGQVAMTIVKENVARMLQRAKGSGGRRWEAHPEVQYQLNALVPEVFWNRHSPAMLAGIPIEWNANLPTIGHCGDIVLHCNDGDVLLADRL